MSLIISGPEQRDVLETILYKRERFAHRQLRADDNLARKASVVPLVFPGAPDHPLGTVLRLFKFWLTNSQVAKGEAES
jgi:hypothetical protein